MMIYTVGKLTEELNRYDENAEVVIAIYLHPDEAGKEENDYCLESVERVVDAEGEVYIRLCCFTILGGN